MPTLVPFRSLTSATLLGVIAACGGRDAPPPASPPGQVPVKVAEVGGLRDPESARYDERRDVWYVSNVNGLPTAADGNGFVTRISGDFQTVDTAWVAGGTNGVLLDAPKGMAIVGDTLWIADITSIRGINVLDGSLVASILVPGAVFLNDIAYGTDGALYITDSGIEFTAAGMSHPGPDRVFRLLGREVTESLRFADASGPNGIAMDLEHGNLVIVPLASSTIYRWTIGDSLADSVASGPGSFDGVVVLADGRVLISSWADSTVHVLDGDVLSPLLRGLPAPADLGVDTVRGHLGIPLFGSGRVEFWTIPLR
jgi:sugar lactone lactonase YvrE